MPNVHFASDHAGVELRQQLQEVARAAGFDVVDHGPPDASRVDYPDQAAKLAEAMAHDAESFGVLVCGTGIGMSICANRYDHLRAALVADAFSAQATRAHNDANVICIGARTIGPGLAATFLNVFLSTPFEGGRHEARVNKFPAGAYI